METKALSTCVTVRAELTSYWCQQIYFFKVSNLADSEVAEKKNSWDNKFGPVKRSFMPYFYKFCLDQFQIYAGQIAKTCY